jgi:hypothetical protein
MVTKNEIENAIKIISDIIIDFSATVDDLYGYYSHSVNRYKEQEE